MHEHITARYKCNPAVGYNALKGYNLKSYDQRDITAPISRHLFLVALLSCEKEAKSGFVIKVAADDITKLSDS